MIYKIRLYGSNRLASETNGLVSLSTVTNYPDVASDIIDGLQPLELDCYFIRPDFEPVDEAFVGVGAFYVTPTAYRDMFDIQSVPISLFTEYEEVLKKLKNILTYRFQYLVIPQYEFDIKNHYGDGSNPKAFCVGIEKTIETNVGTKTISLLCKRRRV